MYRPGIVRKKSQNLDKTNDGMSSGKYNHKVCSFFLNEKNTVLLRKEKTSRLAEYGKTVVWMLMSIYSWLAESVKIGGAAVRDKKIVQIMHRFENRHNHLNRQAVNENNM